MYVCMYVCMYLYMNVCMYVCMYAHTARHVWILCVIVRSSPGHREIAAFSPVTRRVDRVIPTAIKSQFL